MTGPRTSGWGWVQLARVVPRTLVFAAKASRSRPGRPVPPLRRAPWPIAQAAIDDLFVSVAHLSARGGGMPFAVEAVLSEQHEALEVLAHAGVEQQPGLLFEPPPFIVQNRLTNRRRFGVRFEHLSFPSMFRPLHGLPREAQWRADEGNRVAHAYILRRDDRPRPWVVAIHGAGAGEPVDLWWMGSVRLHRRLGVNVMHVVLPRHGPRSRLPSADRFPGFDPLVNLYGFAQAMSDVRAAIAWTRTQHATRLAVHGISLGGYAAALLAGLECDLDCVISGTPVVDFVGLIGRHLARYEGDDHDLMGLLRDPTTRRLNAMVSPLTFPPLLARERRFIYAAIADRLATPEQAIALWEHWNAPETLWLQASHLGAVFAGQTRAFVDAALQSRDIAPVGRPTSVKTSPDV